MSRLSFEQDSHGERVLTVDFSTQAARIGPLAFRVCIDDKWHNLAGVGAGYDASDCLLHVTESRTVLPTGLLLQYGYENRSVNDVILNSIEFLSLANGAETGFVEPHRFRMLVQGAYSGHTEQMFGTDATGHSDHVWLMADVETGDSLLVGFVSSNRWNGLIRTAQTADGRLTGFSVGFDGGDTLIGAGESGSLEGFALLAGDDPLDLLDQYGDIVRDLHQPDLLPRSPVTWCSWYPYRLGVSSERILANARIGADRLAPHGLSTMVVDLGWERDQLPNQFVENDNFPGGLRALADGLEELGLKLGVWAAPTSVSAMEAVAAEHPEWLACDESGKPVSTGTWYWHPHGDVYVLDLTHPGAQEHLRSQMRWLAEQGCRYFKGDFVGNLSSGVTRKRHDQRIAAAGGAEVGRIAANIFRDTLREANPDALLLSCGGPEMPGTSNPDLLYTCNDTGNTGYVGWEHLKSVQLATATHLFKQGRWGVIQPSCLCVGLPGTLAEAQVRATVAFMSGGQIDIGDDLTMLPEDRWRVLLATVPPPDRAAHAVDLVQPVHRTRGGYDTRDTSINLADIPPAPPASVWVLPVETAWDEWKLVAVFNYDEPQLVGDRAEAQLDTFIIPLDRIGLDAAADYTAFEFWSGQACGTLTAEPPEPKAYTHPGDMQVPIIRPTRDRIEVSFFGPGVKLFALREARPYPWVAGTGFHQSCGTELSGVMWNEESLTLSGRIDRPTGEQGIVVVHTGDRRSVGAWLDGAAVPAWTSPHGHTVLPVTVPTNSAAWELVFSPSQS